MQRFLRALQGGQLPGGLRPVLDERFGASAVVRLIETGLLVPGDRATRFPCPRGGSGCPREVVRNPGDAAFPFVGVPPDTQICCPSVRLTDADLRTWRVSRSALVAVLRSLFDIEGPANLREEVFPYALRLGRATWGGIKREVLLCTDLDGPAPVAFLLARAANRQATLVLVHARTRYTSPDVERHFTTGQVVVVFLEDALVLNGLVIRRNQVELEYEPVRPGRAYCLLFDKDGEREVDAATYREVSSKAEEYDLFLDLVTTVGASRYRACRREDERFHKGSLTHQQARGYAELMRRRRPLRAGELQVLNSYGRTDKQVEAARRVLDVKVNRYEWRATKLLRGEDRQAKRYLFNPPEGLRWALVKPIEDRG